MNARKERMKQITENSGLRLRKWEGKISLKKVMIRQELKRQRVLKQVLESYLIHSTHHSNSKKYKQRSCGRRIPCVLKGLREGSEVEGQKQMKDSGSSAAKTAGSSFIYLQDMTGLPFQNILATPTCAFYHVKFRVSLSNSQKPCWCFYWACVNFINKFKEN